MKGYSLHKEFDTHFEVNHPKEGLFRVAKAGLPERSIKAIRALPKAMFDAGRVDAPAPEEPASDSDFEVSSPTSDIFEAAPPAAQPSVPTSFGLTPEDVRTMSGGPGASPGTIPSNPDIEPAALPASKANPNIQNASMPAPLTELPKPPENPYDKAFGLMEKGTKTGMAAAATREQEERAAYQAEQDRIAALTQQKNDALAKNEQEHEMLKQGILDGKIDSNRLWHNMGTGEKVTAAIGLLLSGIGSGLTHGPNMALEVINKAIERDVDAQKAELGKKETLLSENLRKYGNINAAYQATLAQEHTIAIAKVAAATAKAQGTAAQGAGQMALGQLETQRVALKQAAVNSQFGQAIGRGDFANPSAPINLEDPKLAPYKERLIQRPNGGILLSKTKEEAPKVQDALSDLDSFEKSVDYLIKLHQDNGRTIPLSEASKLGKQGVEALVLETPKLHGINRLNEQEIEIAKGQVPDPGAWRSDTSLAMLMRLKKQAAEKRETVLSNHTEGFNPGRAAARTVSAPGLETPSVQPVLTSGP